jgi:tRNA(fMet)-specific endonuclease VapC
VAVRIALDSNRYVDLAAGVPETVALVEGAEVVFIPFVVLAELRAGFACGSRQVENERTLRGFLSLSGFRSLFCDDATTRQYAAVYQQLRKQGTPIPGNDMWIAALVLQHGLFLHHRDEHFALLPQLATV